MKEEVYRTSNGVAVYGMRNTALHGFYISLFVKAGSMYEGERENGITHFLEHVAVRNVNERHSGELYRILDRYGIEFNASTYNEMVQFYVSGADKNFAIGASVIAELLSPLKLTPKDVDAERSRIRAEIRESDDKTSLFTFSNKLVFQGTSLSRPITGRAGAVGSFSAKRLEEYRRSIFTKENIFFYVTGNYTDSDISVLINEIDGYTVGSAEPRGNIAPVPEKFFRRDAEVHVKNADYTMARFTFDIDMSKVTLQKTDILYDILLSGYSSDFFVELSEKRGLFYDLTGAVERYGNIGTLSFSYELKLGKLYEAIEMTVGILNSYKTEMLTEERLMKAGYVDNARMLCDDIRELNFTFSYDNHIMDLGYSSIDDRISAYRSVSPYDILNASKEIFTVKNLTLALKGDKKKIDTNRLSDIIRKLG